MNLKKIRLDAETFVQRKSILQNIGDKLTKRFPKQQYMGILNYLIKLLVL